MVFINEKVIESKAMGDYDIGYLFIFFCPLNVQQTRLLFPVYTTFTNYVAVCHSDQREHNFYTVYIKFLLQAFLPKKGLE